LLDSLSLSLYDLSKYLILKEKYFVINKYKKRRDDQP